MTILGKDQMSEEDIKLNYIAPVILKGWKGHTTLEIKITGGHINFSGNIVAHSKPKLADYCLLSPNRIASLSQSSKKSCRCVNG